MIIWILSFLLTADASNHIMKNLFYISEGKMQNVSAEFFYSVDNDNFRGPFIWKRDNSIHVFRNIPLRLFSEIKQDELVRVLSKLKPFPEDDLPAFLKNYQKKVDLKQLRAQKEEHMGMIALEKISLEEEEMYLRQMARFSKIFDNQTEGSKEGTEEYDFISAILYACFILEMFACGIMLVMAIFVVQAYYRSKTRIVGNQEMQNHGALNRKLAHILAHQKQFHQPMDHV